MRVLSYIVSVIAGLIIGFTIAKVKKPEHIDHPEKSQTYYLAIYGKVDSVENYQWLFDKSEGLIVNVPLNKELADLPSGLPEYADMNIWVNRFRSSEWQILRIDSFFINKDGTQTEDYFASISQDEKNLDRRIAHIRRLERDGNYLFKIFLHKKEATTKDVEILREDIKLGRFHVAFLSNGLIKN